MHPHWVNLVPFQPAGGQVARQEGELARSQVFECAQLSVKDSGYGHLGRGPGQYGAAEISISHLQSTFNKFQLDSYNFVVEVSHADPMGKKEQATCAGSLFLFSQPVIRTDT